VIFRVILRKSNGRRINCGNQNSRSRVEVGLEQANSHLGAILDSDRAHRSGETAKHCTGPRFRLSGDRKRAEGQSTAFARRCDRPDIGVYESNPRENPRRRSREDVENKEGKAAAKRRALQIGTLWCGKNRGGEGTANMGQGKGRTGGNGGREREWGRNWKGGR